MVQKIQELELRLGAPNLGQTRLTKMSDWIHIHDVINDMRKKAKVLENGHRG